MICLPAPTMTFLYHKFLFTLRKSDLQNNLLPKLKQAWEKNLEEAGVSGKAGQQKSTSCSYMEDLGWIHSSN